MRFGTAKPSDPGKKMYELLEAAVLRARADDTCTWADGSEASFAVADIARVPTYCEPCHFDPASSHALGRVYPLDRVAVSDNDTIRADVSAIVGACDPSVLSRAYVAYLVATRAADDGFDVMLSATGSEAVLLTSLRIPAAFDEDDERCYLLRKSVWGVKGALLRYSGLVGATVKARAGEPLINAMQRHEFTIAREIAAAEVAAGAALGVSVRHPFLSPKVSGYTTTLHHSLRYGKKAYSRLSGE